MSEAYLREEVGVSTEVSTSGAVKKDEQNGAKKNGHDAVRHSALTRREVGTPYAIPLNTILLVSAMIDANEAERSRDMSFNQCDCSISARSPLVSASMQT